MKSKYDNPSAQAAYERLIDNPAVFPSSFQYGNKRYHGFPEEDFTLLSREKGGAAGRQTCRLVLDGPQNLRVIVDTAFYPVYGVYEWVMRFENIGQEDTDILSELTVCDMLFPGKNPVLKGILGDHGNQYKPYTHNLGLAPVSFVSDTGRPTHHNFPYFNLEHGDGGTMLALGWAGTWSAEFTKVDEQHTRLRARSVNGLRLALRMKESIRTGLMVIAPYTRRDEDYATNFWRSWFVNCNLPKADARGNPLTPFSLLCFASDTGRPNSDGSISEAFDTWKPTLDKAEKEGLLTDFRWFDAGWYCDPHGKTVSSDWWGTVGTWVLDPVKWPGETFRESVDYAHARGMKTLVWFEPERVTSPDALAENYGYNPAWAIQRAKEAAISNDLGNPDCFEWTTSRIVNMLKDNKVDMYREDNNADPGGLWRELDNAVGRQGMTECRAVDAHYRMWDLFIAATAAHGGCAFCDSCASGGGRNDIESLRRGVPLLRSDADRTTTALRLSMTTSFNRYIPFCGSNTKEKLSELSPFGKSDVYTWRASYLPSLNMDAQFVQDPDQDFDILRFGLNEWKSIRHLLLKDFYVLTPWHSPTDKSGFTAFAYVDEEAEDGVLFIFRMEE